MKRGTIILVACLGVVVIIGLVLFNGYLNREIDRITLTPDGGIEHQQIVEDLSNKSSAKNLVYVNQSSVVRSSKSVASNEMISEGAKNKNSVEIYEIPLDGVMLDI